MRVILELLILIIFLFGVVSDEMILVGVNVVCWESDSKGDNMCF